MAFVDILGFKSLVDQMTKDPDLFRLVRDTQKELQKQARSFGIRTIEFTGIEFATADEAIQHADASGRGEPVLIGGKAYVTEKAEAERLAAAGVSFAYLVVHGLPDGSSRVMTIPVN